MTQPQTLATSQQQPDFKSLQAAAEWFAILKSDDVTAEDKEQWTLWLTAASEHRMAWSRIESVSRQFEPLQQNNAPAIATLNASRTTPVGRRALLSSLVGVAGLGVLASWRYTSLPETIGYWRADHRTAIGQVDTFALNDGTKIWLSADTAINIDYSPEFRRLQLLQGEILIKTATDSRIFSVVTEQGQLTPLGTEFSVRRLSDVTGVSVFEGAVKVVTDTSGMTNIIHAGQQIHFSKTRIHPSQVARSARRNWSRGLLMADDISLAELLEELAPFHHGYINLSPALADMRVMGTFPLNDVDETIKMLASTLSLRVEKRLHWWIDITAQ